MDVAPRRHGIRVLIRQKVHAARREIRVVGLDARQMRLHERPNAVGELSHKLLRLLGAAKSTGHAMRLMSPKSTPSKPSRALFDHFAAKADRKRVSPQAFRLRHGLRGGGIVHEALWRIANNRRTRNEILHRRVRECGRAAR